MYKPGLFLVVFSVLGSAQETPSTTDASKLASIEGVVVNELTKEPVRKVEISLRKQGVFGPNAAYSGLTDAAGKFRVENIEPAEYMVMQRRTGFIVPHSSSGFSARLLKLSAGQSLTGLRYTLVPQGIISGHVVDDEGDPCRTSMWPSCAAATIEVRAECFPWDGRSRPTIAGSFGSLTCSQDDTSCRLTCSGWPQ